MAVRAWGAVPAVLLVLVADVSGAVAGGAGVGGLVVGACFSGGLGGGGVEVLAGSEPACWVGDVVGFSVEWAAGCCGLVLGCFDDVGWRGLFGGVFPGFACVLFGGFAGVDGPPFVKLLLIVR